MAIHYIQPARPPKGYFQHVTTTYLQVPVSVFLVLWLRKFCLEKIRLLYLLCFMARRTASASGNFPLSAMMTHVSQPVRQNSSKLLQFFGKAYATPFSLNPHEQYRACQSDMNQRPVLSRVLLCLSI